MFFSAVPSMVANNDEQAFKKSLLWLLRAKRCTMHARLTDENIEDFVNEVCFISFSFYWFL